MNRLREAQESMRRAVDQRDTAGARRAAEGLRDAMAALGGLQRNDSANQVDELGKKAEQLASRARQQQGTRPDRKGFARSVVEPAVTKCIRQLPAPRGRPKNQRAKDRQHNNESAHCRIEGQIE